MNGSPLNLNSYVISVDATTWSPGDWFGIGSYGAWPQGTPPGLPFALADDSVADVSGNGTGSPFPSDSQGIIRSTFGASNGFLGVADTNNSLNGNFVFDGSSTTGSSAPVAATWVFDVSSASGPLSLSIDAAAMGDFEDGINDSSGPGNSIADFFSIEYAFDGGSYTTLVSTFVDVAADLSRDYTMEGGSTYNYSDPMDATVTGGSTVALSNLFQTLTGSLVGSGSTLSVRLTAEIDGSSEVFAFDNLLISTAASLVGDLNGDGFVGQDDLNIVLGAWGTNVTPGDPLAGDPSGDGFVGQDDLNDVLAGWGQGTPPSGLVPEPASAALLALGGLAMLRRRR